MPRLFHAMFPFCVLLAAAPTVRAQGPMVVMSERGLKTAGKFLVLPDEASLMQKIYNLRPLMADMQGKFNVWYEMLSNEQLYQYLTDYQIKVEAYRQDVARQVAAMPTRTPLDRFARQEALNHQQMVEQELRATNTQVAMVQKRLVPDHVKTKAEREFNEKREKFVDAKKSFWPEVEDLMGKYGEFKRDSGLRNAIRVHYEQKKVSLKIGPSDGFTKAAKQVIAYERDYSPETATRPKPRPKSRLKGLANTSARGTTGSRAAR